MKKNGFTLTELMITVAILGILATIALPSYQSAMMAAKRSDGISAALSLQLAQQKFRGNCAFYAGVLGGANVCGASAGASEVKHGALSSEGYYKLSISGASGNAYVIIATPQGSQASDTSCSPMKITISAATPDGLKTPTDCWD